MRVRRPFFLLLFGVQASIGQTLPSEHTIEHGGQRRLFVIATDEIQERRKVRKIAPARTANETRERARQMPDAELVLYEKGAARSLETQRLLTKRLIARLAPGADPIAVSRAADVAIAGRAPGSSGWFIMISAGAPGSALDAVERLRRVKGVLQAQPLLARQYARRALIPNDPLFADQFHLRNDGQQGATPGIDINVSNIWPRFRGAGITIGIIDDGVEHTHPDLEPNYDPTLSRDFNGEDTDPLPPPFNFDDHGTACAGIAAARGNNARGVCGTAFESNFSGLRLISAPTTDEEDAAAFAFRNDKIFIKSSSWGPPDNGRNLEGPGPLARAAIVDGAATGRAGKGTIFVFSAGNGGPRDGVNFDGFTAMRETIAVSAVAADGLAPRYAEPGASILCVAPSSDDAIGTVTTDRQDEDGYNFAQGIRDFADLDYTRQFGGTSSAAPTVAGCIALMLEANPALGWRDVQEILIRTARRVDDLSPDWQINGAGFHFHHFYGAGLVDAEAAVIMAETWTNLGPNSLLVEDDANLAAPIPEGRSNEVARTFFFNNARFRVEHVVLTVDLLHRSRGQLEISIESPSGTVSRLANARPRDKGDHFLGWSFLSRQMWGEPAQGVWTVRITDRVKGTVGTLQGLRLELFGSSPEGHPVADGQAVVGETKPNGAIDPGETVTVALTLKNEGTTTAADVVAVLLASDTVTTPGEPQNFGTLAPGASATREFAFTAQANLGETIFLMLQLADSAGSIGTVHFPATIGLIETRTFASNLALQIPARSRNGGGSAKPYPANIEVLGLPANAVITDLKLHLHHLAHDRSSDVDLLLVSPDGKAVVPMSDAGAADLRDVSLTFDDAAVDPLPLGVPVFSGTFRPTNHQAVNDIFPSPAPRKPYGRHLAEFRGASPNGHWRLFIRDDRSRFFGALAEWSLEITYAH